MDDITKDNLEAVGESTEGNAILSEAGSESVPEDGDGMHAEINSDEACCETEIRAVDAENNVSNKVAKKPLPQKIQKIVDYLNSHEDVRQMVFFLMFSVLCGLSQMIVTYALSAGLKLASGLGSDFDWFVFHFATTAEFIGFLVGSVVGQVLTFVLNRKKTFNMPDYLALRAVMYTILAIIIIIMQTYLGGVVTSACYNAMPEADGFLALVFNLTGQAVAGIAAVIVNFLGNKFLVMRDWGKKKREAQSAKTSAEAPVVDTDEQVEV